MCLKVWGLCFFFGLRPALADVGFEAADGRLTAVLGPNGAGKTTLFNCILGLRRRYEGEILLDGENAARLSARALAQRVAYIPQSHAQAVGYTALDMALMGAARALGPLSSPGRREKEAAMAALERLDIARLAGREFTRLSGGERQLVLIARALAQRTRTLLMDEPTASLDYGNQARVLSLVRGLADEGYAVLMTTHDPQHALWYADTTLALCGGRVAALGPTRRVVDAAFIERLYGVRATLTDTEAGPMIAPVREGGARRV